MRVMRLVFEKIKRSYFFQTMFILKKKKKILKIWFFSLVFFY